jgi:GTP-binding protein
LNRLGVEQRLLELGAEEGDAVLIGAADNAVVFDFRPMVETGAELLGRRGEDARLEESRPAARRRRDIEAAMDTRAAGETRADVARRQREHTDQSPAEPATSQPNAGHPDFGWAEDDPGERPSDRDQQ